MVKQNVVRETLTGTEKAITFTASSSKYIVKNYTSSDIYVSFYTPFETNNAIKIASGMGQECVINERFYPSTNVIYVLGTGEVEIQQL